MVDGENKMLKMNLLTIGCMNHDEINNELLTKIIAIKSQHWKYSLEDQMKWILENINDKDKHLMILNSEDILIAYMNLVNCKINIENMEYDVLGIGNVCVAVNNTGKNMGKLLMNACSYYLNNINKTGILLCKDRLVSFYSKAGWKQFNNKLLINNEVVSSNVFFSDDKFLSASEIVIDRNF